MKHPFCALTAVVSAAVISSAASAGVPFGAGETIIVPYDSSSVSVVFDYASALFPGKLYFMGTGDENSVLNPAPNSNATGLGQYLFHNHLSPIGQTKFLTGTFHAGDVLHFAYDILGPNTLTDLLRTDTVPDADQFAWDSAETVIAVEDTLLGGPDCDEDYNDIVVGVNFNPVPAPAALAALAMAGLLGRGRRRH